MATASPAVTTLHAEPQRRLARQFRALLRRLNGRALLGLILVGGMVLAGLFAPFIVSHDPELADITQRLQPPVWSPGGSSSHLLGTDALGRDLLARILFGARISLSVGVVSVLLAGALGVSLGLVAGYFGRGIDNVIMRAVDIMFAFPFLLLAVTWMAIFQAGRQSVISILVLTGWATFCRMVRGQVLSIREREYISAARVLGVPSWRLIFRHILPNVVPTLTVVATMTLAQFILAEAALSFLGLGVEPQTPTWGVIVNEGRDYISQAWWIETFGGLAIVLTVSGIGLLGDWLRDILDPRLRIL